MTTTEPIQGGPYPLPADSPDGPSQMSAIVAWAAGRLAMRFATATARDAAIPSPVVGMQCYRADRQWVETYIGSAWVPTAGRLPYILLKRTTNAAPATAVDTVLSSYDASPSVWQITEASGVVTVPVAGLYAVSAQGVWAASATGSRRIRITRNGDTEIVAASQIGGTSGDGVGAAAINPGVSLAASDTLRMRIYQNSGSTLNLAGASSPILFSVRYVGPA